MPSYALEDKVGEKRDGRGIVAKTKVTKKVGIQARILTLIFG